MIINVQTLGTLLRSLQAGETAGRPGPLLPLAPTQAVKPVSSEDSTSQQATAQDAGTGDTGPSARTPQPAVEARSRGRGPAAELPPAHVSQLEREPSPPGRELDPAVVVNIGAAAQELSDFPGSALASTDSPAGQHARLPSTAVQAAAVLPATAAAAAQSTVAAEPGAVRLMNVLVRLAEGEPIRGAAAELLAGRLPQLQRGTLPLTRALDPAVVVNTGAAAQKVPDLPGMAPASAGTLAGSIGGQLARTPGAAAQAASPLSVGPELDTVQSVELPARLPEGELIRAAPGEPLTARLLQPERATMPPGRLLDPVVDVDIGVAAQELPDLPETAPASAGSPTGPVAGQLTRAPGAAVPPGSLLAAMAPAAAAASAQAPGAQPAAASLRLSGAAQLIDVLARLPGGEPIRAATPLATAAPTPETLATGLAQSITRSGVFYESHLANWALQRLPEAQLRLEPQASWPAAPPQVGGDRESPPAAVVAPMAGAEPEVLPTTTASTAPVTSSLPATVPDAAPPLVRQQLDVLETGQVLWRGDVWPGQPAQIEIAEDRGSAAPDTLPVWRTRLVLALPALGGVEANLALAGNRLQLSFAVTQPDSAAVLAAEIPALVGALSARAFEVAPVVMRDADRG